MSKITVKHFLNKRLKAKIIDNKEKYPLYVQIIFKGNKAQIKSRAFLEIGIETKYLSEIEFNNIENDIEFLEIEKKEIIQTIELLHKNNVEIDFSNISDFLKSNENIISTLNFKLSRLFAHEAKLLYNDFPLTFIFDFFKNSDFYTIIALVKLLNPVFDVRFSEFYRSIKIAFEVFIQLYEMRFFQWKYGDGKEVFLAILKEMKKDKPEKYYKKIIFDVDMFLHDLH